MSSMSPFEKATEDDIKEWYEFLGRLENDTAKTDYKNPFSPTFSGDLVSLNKGNKNIGLCGVVGTNEPLYKPSQISNIDAIVQRAEGSTVINNGKGERAVELPDPIKREIVLGFDTRNLLAPVSTECAPSVKYPALSLEELSKVAEGIIKEENEPNDFPPGYIKLNDERLEKSELKSFLVRGTINSFKSSDNNVGMIPNGDGAAAFYDYSVIVRNDMLKDGDILKFGMNGKHFKYNVEYTIRKSVKSASARE